MKTRPAICRRKKRFPDIDQAEAAAQAAAQDRGVKLRVYRCELCRDYHLTSRTKGMKVPRYELDGCRARGGEE